MYLIVLEIYLIMLRGVASLFWYVNLIYDKIKKKTYDDNW